MSSHARRLAGEGAPALQENTEIRRGNDMLRDVVYDLGGWQRIVGVRRDR